MKKTAIYLMSILSFPVLLHAQYSGGIGRGDVSGILSGALLPLQEVKIELPVEYSLAQNYPNPFNPSTRIKYSLPKVTMTKITIFNVLGKEVDVLVNEQIPAGTFELTWRSDNLPCGIYFYQLKTGEFIETRKMVLIK